MQSTYMDVIDKNGKYPVVNWAANSALKLLKDRLLGYNPSCTLIGYVTLDDEIELYLKADSAEPYFTLNALFEPWLIGKTLQVVELSVAIDQRQLCYIRLRRVEPQVSLKSNKKRSSR